MITALLTVISVSNDVGYKISPSDAIHISKENKVSGYLRLKNARVRWHLSVDYNDIQEKITKLKEAGAKEIHVRPACPPLMFPCIYNLSTRTTKELVARRAIKDLEGKEIEDVSEYIDQSSEKYKKMVDWIADDLGVTSLRYQLLDDMIAAIGLPEERLCTYCWTGKKV